MRSCNLPGTALTWRDRYIHTQELLLFEVLLPAVSWSTPTWDVSTPRLVGLRYMYLLRHRRSNQDPCAITAVLRMVWLFCLVWEYVSAVGIHHGIQSSCSEGSQRRGLTSVASAEQRKGHGQIARWLTIISGLHATCSSRMRVHMAYSPDRSIGRRIASVSQVSGKAPKTAQTARRGASP